MVGSALEDNLVVVVNLAVTILVDKLQRAGSTIVGVAAGLLKLDAAGLVALNVLVELAHIPAAVNLIVVVCLKSLAHDECGGAGNVAFHVVGQLYNLVV